MSPLSHPPSLAFCRLILRTRTSRVESHQVTRCPRILVFDVLPKASFLSTRWKPDLLDFSEPFRPGLTLLIHQISWQKFLPRYPVNTKYARVNYIRRWNFSLIMKFRIVSRSFRQVNPLNYCVHVTFSSLTSFTLFTATVRRRTRTLKL